MQSGFFAVFKTHFLNISTKKLPFSFGNSQKAVVWVLKGEIIKNHPLSRLRKENMNEPNRTEWEIRCAFNSFCKKAIKCEASNAHRDVRRHQLREVTLSSLSPQEESQLYTVDRYFVKEYTDDSICVAGKRITPKLLAEALRTLPEEKRNAVLLYYFEGMTDNDIAKLLNISRSTVQYRRTSSFELLKRYLEERAYDDEEI